MQIRIYQPSMSFYCQKPMINRGNVKCFFYYCYCFLAFDILLIVFHCVFLDSKQDAIVNERMRFRLVPKSSTIFVFMFGVQKVAVENFES